ncbi:MYND-type domain-containing protein [Salix suchowensis]|nr:MYND-type domain-containing protein [Salix suchowensis]
MVALSSHPVRAKQTISSAYISRIWATDRHVHMPRHSRPDIYVSSRGRRQENASQIPWYTDRGLWDRLGGGRCEVSGHIRFLRRGERRVLERRRPKRSLLDMVQDREGRRSHPRRFDPYNESCPLLELAPAFWRDRVINRNTPSLHTERQRLSVLHNTELHAVVTFGRNTLRPQDAQAIWNFMSQISSEPMPEIERQMAVIWTVSNCIQMKAMLEAQAWKRYPPTPTLALDLDPGERGGDDEPAEEWTKFLKKWKKLKKRGGTAESIADAFKRWQQKVAA